MAIKKMDPTPYLIGGESVILKAHAKTNKIAALEVGLCYVIWLLTICGDCFIIAAAFGMKQYETLRSGYLAIVIALFVVHLVPFVFWVLYSIRKMTQRSEKWYALTEKRLLIVQDKKPISVTFVELSEITAISNGKDSIVLYLNEERVKLDGLDDVTAFSDRLELLAFGEEEERERVVLAKQRKNSEKIENLEKDDLADSKEKHGKNKNKKERRK